MLEGKLYDDRGHPMVVSHATKGQRRYRYYICCRAKISGLGQAGSLPRISVGLIKAFIAEHVGPKLAPRWVPEQGDRIGQAPLNWNVQP